MRPAMLCFVFFAPRKKASLFSSSVIPLQYSSHSFWLRMTRLRVTTLLKIIPIPIAINPITIKTIQFLWFRKHTRALICSGSFQRALSFFVRRCAYSHISRERPGNMGSIRIEPMSPIILLPQVSYHLTNFPG